MPKLSSKFLTVVPDSIVASKRHLTISKADWRRIENAYGQQLPNGVREAVVKATQEFVGWEMAEQEAKPISIAKKQIEAWKKAAGVFRGRLVTSGSTAGVMRLLIKNNFRTSLRRVGEPFYFLNEMLTDFEKACERALSKLGPTPLIITLKEGDMWQWWINQLSKIMKGNSLPSTVRKDSDKSAKLSPFVVFVRELQKCLPKESNFPTHSDRALAEAIVRARAVVSGHKRLAPRPE